MTDEMIRQLMEAGLSKTQATSVTAKTMVKLFMQEDGKILIQEAQRQVSEMQKLVIGLKSEYDDLKQKMESVSETILAVVDAQKEHGAVTDDKAKNVLALYSALIGMNMQAGASGDDAVRNASYIVYAYLGGQAKREITYPNNHE